MITKRPTCHCFSSSNGMPMPAHLFHIQTLHPDDYSPITTFQFGCNACRYRSHLKFTATNPSPRQVEENLAFVHEYGVPEIHDTSHEAFRNAMIQAAKEYRSDHASPSFIAIENDPPDYYRKPPSLKTGRGICY